jgi:hypothetical protein
MNTHSEQTTASAAGKTRELAPRKVAEQAETELVEVTTIMLSPSFRRGVEEYRARRKPNFEDGDWAYERGRQFAAITPPDLPITTPKGRLTRKALAIFVRNIQ